MRTLTSFAAALAPIVILLTLPLLCSSTVIDPDQFDNLVGSYIADGLPIPPPEAPLIRVKIGTRGGPHGTDRNLYVLGFLLSKNDVTHEADILIGSFRDHVDTNDYPVEVVDSQQVELADVSADYLFRTTFDLNTGLATAIQCQARGYKSLAQNLAKLSLSDTNLNRGGPGAVWSNGAWTPERTHVSQAEPNAATPLDDMLAALAWNHWMNEMVRPDSDWKMIASHFENLLTSHPFLADEPRKALLASMQAALVPSHAQHDSLDASMDQLVFISGGLGGMNSKPDATVAVCDKITALGFGAVPTLIQHLDDKRLTHSVIVGFNNFRSLPRRVCDMASDMLQEIAGEDVGQDWISRQIGNSVDKSSALKWWAEAQKEDEQSYLMRHVISEGSNGTVLNETQLKIIAIKYPHQLASLCDRVVTKYPKVDSGAVLEAYTGSSLPQEQKIERLTHIIRESHTRARFYALRNLIKLDRVRGEDNLIQQLSAMPRDTNAPYWLSPEASLSYLVVESDNPKVWNALLLAGQRAKVGLRLELMEPMDYSNLENRQIKQRLNFLRAFMQDTETRTISEPNPADTEPSPVNKYDGPCAAFTFPVIEVRNFAAREMGNILQIGGEAPQPEWTSEQWEKYRARVFASLKTQSN